MEFKCYVYNKEDNQLSISGVVFTDSATKAQFLGRDYMIGELLLSPPKELTDLVNELPNKWEDEEEVYKLASQIVDDYYYVEVRQLY